MRSLPRILAGAAAVLAVTLSLSACDSSPFAASINGQVIKETGLNAELRQLSANTKYIADIDENADGASVVGAASGTYSTAWTAHVLTGIVTADAAHQDLVAHHDLPDDAMLTAARDVEAANYETLWSGFSASYRTTLTDRLADEAVLESPSAPSSDLSSDYTQFRNYFFSHLCLRSAAVSVTGVGGGVDYAKSLSQADALARSITSGSPSSAGATLTCYTPAQLEAQSQSFISTVLGLAVGAAASPQRTSYGYQVTALTSRTVLPLNSTLKRALSAAITAGEANPTLDALLARDHVKVNPAYGSWTGSAAKGFAVEPPKAPKT